MLHGCVLRSPYAHARVKSINIAKALEHPGVKAIITAEDFPEVKGGMAQVGELIVNTHYLSFNLMAHDKVLYDGHAVAAVAATSRHIAQEALETDRGRVRVVETGHDCRRGDEAGRADPAR